MSSNNLFQVSNLVVNNMLDDYVNSLRTTSLADPFNKFDNNATVGTSMRVSYPLQYTSVPSLTYTGSQVNSSVDRYRYISLVIQRTVPIALTASQMSFESSASTVDEFMNKFGRAMITQLGTDVNADVISDEIVMNWTDTIGSPSQPLNGLTTLANINAQRANMAIPMNQQLHFGVSPTSAASLQTPYSGYFNSSVNQSILKEDTNNDQALSGIKMYMDQAVQTHQNGTFATGGTVTVATTVPLTTTINDTGTAVSLAGFTASQTGVLLRGDKISFGSSGASNIVYAVNPKSRLAYNNPKYFVVTDTSVDSDGAGAAVVTVFPPIVAATTGAQAPYRNVSRQVVSGMQVNLLGGANGVYVNNFCFIRSGLLFANPSIASYPLMPSTQGRTLSAYPNERLFSTTVPETMMKIAYNLASLGDLRMFENELAARTIAGAAAFNGYGFCVVSSQ